MNVIILGLLIKGLEEKTEIYYDIVCTSVCLEGGDSTDGCSIRMLPFEDDFVPCIAHYVSAIG